MMQLARMRRIGASLTVVLLATAAMGTNITYYVDGSAGSDAHNGTQNWSKAFLTLTNALAFANAKGSASVTCQVWVAGASTGTVYYPTTDGDPAKSFLVTNKYVNLYGGFTNGGSFADRNWSNNLTILSGGGIAYHVLLYSNVPSVMLSLDGFTVTGGNAVGAGPINSKGGGLYATNVAPLLISNCIFSYNNAVTNGGGLAFDGTATVGSGGILLNSSVISNSCGSLGGGLYCNSQTTTYTVYVTNCTFSGNWITNAPGSTTWYGAGAYWLYGACVVNNCVFSNNHVDVNSASAKGGGLYSAVTCQILNSQFYTNKCGTGAGNNGKGAAAFCSANATSFITNSLFANNVAYGGGAVCGWNPSVVMLNCIFSNNFGYAGAAYCYGNSDVPIATNCTFFGNRAIYYGGAIYTANTAANTARLDTCTFLNNTVTTNSGGYGGAVCFYNGSNVAAHLIANCTFSGNICTNSSGSYGGAGAIELWAVSATIQNCAFVTNGGATAGTGGIAFDPNYAFPYSCLISNCTFHGNYGGKAGALYGFAGTASVPYSPVVINSIFWGNSSPAVTNTIVGGIITNSYSNIQGCGGSGAGWKTNMFGNGASSDGGGNIDKDPFFANPGALDVHLKSMGGHYAGTNGVGAVVWVLDSVNSPCIGKGNPLSDNSLAPTPKSSRIEMGAYGDTLQASKPWQGGTTVFFR